MPEEGIELLKHEDLLTYEEILRLVDVYARHGISKIRLTGGEPLVRRDVVDLVKWIGENPHITDVSLTTNGVRLKDYAFDLRQAGLRRINISLDSLRRDRFAHITRRDRFNDVWEGVEASLRCGFTPVKINVVVINGINDDEVRDFAQLSVEYPLHVRFIEFMPVGNGNDWSEDRVYSNSFVMEEIRQVGDLIPVTQLPSNRGPAECYRLRGSKGEIGFIAPITSHFCATCNRLRLTPDGHIRPCLFSDDELNIKQVLRRYPGDEARLMAMLHEALRRKPRGHRIGDVRFKKCQREMYAIGG
jgi:cyclic pyranopterin phosphate synthase